MTINKSQGQTFQKIGIYLRKPCFTHGQLDVAFLRVRMFQNVKIKVIQIEQLDGKIYTQNVVFLQVIS